MDISGISGAATSIAETGTKQDVDMAVLKKAMQIQTSTATALIDAIQPAPTANLPAHLGNHINTKA
ncbi:MAG: YjfB family protein [Pseudomonadota bacterium]